MSLLASQYIRAGQNLKDYFEEGGNYLSYSKLRFLAHYLVGKRRSFTHGKFPQGNSQNLLFISGGRQTSAKSPSGLESYIQLSSNGARGPF